MSSLQLVKSENFGAVQCDIYKGDGEFYMTREQIGAALEYSSPMIAIQKIHDRHKERLDQFSLTTLVNGRNIYLYTRKGIMEICRWSQQPKADAFMDWAWEVLDGLMAGKTVLLPMSEYQKRMIATREENIRTRKAQLLTRMAEKYEGTTYQQVLHSYATKELTGEHLLPLPSLPQKTMTATEIGQKLGITANMVGILTNRHGLKTDQYGAWFNDKARGHDKEVQSFRYYENVIPVLGAILSNQTA